MKKISTLLILISAVFSLQAQSIVIDTPLDNFDEMQVRGIIEVHYTQGGDPHLKCTVSDKAKDAFIYKVEGSILYLETNRSPESIAVYISSPMLKIVDLASTATFNSKGTIKGTSIKFITAGAAELGAVVDCDKLELQAEGASEVNLEGKTNSFKTVVKGAAKIDAKKMDADDVDISASGASDVKVTSNKSLKVYAEGAADVSYLGEPETVDVELEGIASVNDRNALDDVIVDGGDTVSLDYKEIVLNNEDNDIDKNDFDGHWGGFDMAFCGFLNNNNELNTTTPGYSFMENELARSWSLHLNFIEQNFNLIRNHVGLVTGLGLHINNYRLNKDVRLISDSARLMSWSDTINNTIRSKLVSSYLILPLMLEYQTNGENEKNSFHIGIGGVVGTRLSSHTKVSVDNGDGKDKFKSYDKFHLNPIKYGLMARIGWGHLNLFANYSLSTMFAENEGPEVFPLEFGITIVGW